MLGSNGFLIAECAISDGALRVVFKIYLLLVGIIAGLAGGQAVRLYVRNQLLKHKSVPLSTTTEWVQGSGLGKAIWSLRHLPGGYFGWVMLLLTALDIVGELAVAKAITKVSAHGGNTSTRGMIIDSQQRFSVAPDAVSGAYQYASSVQLTNANNEQYFNSTAPRYGIYRFIPEFLDSDFLATKRDTIGDWQCSKTTMNPILYNPRNTSFWSIDSPRAFAPTVVRDLISRGLLYNTTVGNGNPSYTYTTITQFSNGLSYFSDLGPASHLVALTTNSSGTGSVFSVKAAVDTEDVVSSNGALLGPVNTDTFECDLIATDLNQTVFEVSRAINSSYAMSSFVSTIAGGLYPVTFAIKSFHSDAIETSIAYYLNSMIMASGPASSILTNNTEEYTYGVVLQATILPYWVLVMCIIYGLAMLGVVLMCLMLWIKNKKLSKSYDSTKTSLIPSEDIKEYAPVGLEGWTKYATYQSGNGKFDLKNFKPASYVLDMHARGREASTLYRDMMMQAVKRQQCTTVHMVAVLNFQKSTRMAHC